MPAWEKDCSSFVRTYFQGLLRGGSIPLSSQGLKTACLREVLINNQEKTPGGIISFKGIKKCLLDVPLINPIWLCQSPVTRSPCSGAGLLREDGAVPVRAAHPSSTQDPHSACSSAPLSASGKPEVNAPAWAPTFPNPFPSNQGLFPKK